MSGACSISGQPASEPVVSKTGYIFDRPLIVKYIEANGKCPITQEPLTVNDLVAIQTSKIVKPRPPVATSIPSMLQLFQNEWDALMLESFQQKQQLEAVRQELSQALYQHDAACRVIARLINERDSARNALATAQAKLSSFGEEEKSTPMDTSESVITEEIKHKMNELSKKLSSERKKRVPPPTLPSTSQLEGFCVLNSFTLHKTTDPGLNALDIHSNQHLVATAGNDKTVVLFDRKTEKKVTTLNGHTKAVTDVLFHPSEDLLFSSSQDKTVKIWSSSNSGYSCSQTLKAHTGSVVGLTLHALKEYLVSASTDGSWAFHDIRSGTCLAHVTHPDNKSVGLSCTSFHPDGLILGTGTENGLVRIWDIKTQKNIVSFEHEGLVSDVSFSENGYYLATASEKGSIKLWDLRKLINIQTYTPQKQNVVVKALDFDPSGTYLAAAGSDITIFLGKNLEVVKTLSDHKGMVNDVQFSADSATLASVSLDRTLKTFGAKE